MSIYAFIIIITTILTFIGLWKVFIKAGVKGWYSIIPILNAWYAVKIINKKFWWFIYCLIPFINIFVAMLIIIEIMKCFRKNGLLIQIAGVLFPFVILPWLGFSKKETYTHPSELPKIKNVNFTESIQSGFRIRREGEIDCNCNKRRIDFQYTPSQRG